jgi:hypothetical protein
MLLAAFELATPARERPQTDAIDRVAGETCLKLYQNEKGSLENQERDG